MYIISCTTQNCGESSHRYDKYKNDETHGLAATPRTPSYCQRRWPLLRQSPGLPVDSKIAWLLYLPGKRKTEGSQKREAYYVVYEEARKVTKKTRRKEHAARTTSTLASARFSHIVLWRVCSRQLTELRTN